MNVVVVGCGVRGALVAGLLASAGVEELSLVDGAIVEQDDLGAHPLQFTPDIHAAKPEALAAKLGLVNPAVFAQPFPAYVEASNAAAIIAGSDAVVDCTGSAEATAALSEACAESAIPLVEPPADFSAEVDVALASAVGAEQAAAVLALRRAD